MKSVSLKAGTLYLGISLSALLTVFSLLPADAGVLGERIQIQSGAHLLDLAKGRSHVQEGVQVALSGTEVKGGSADIQVDASGKPSKALFTKRSTMVRKEGGGLTQTIQADTLQMDLKSNGLEARGGVSTQLSGDKQLGNISIQSESQIFDQERHLMKAIGGVVVKKDDMTASSPEAIIFMNAAGKAEKAVFIKGALLKQGKQELRGQTITIQLSSGDIFAENNTQSIVLDKDASGKETRVNITSHLQELDKASGRLIANGNAVIHYDDYVAKGPKAVFFRQNGSLDHIVLSGRAQIEDSDRKVTGDVVTITVNPKQFNAKGNVTTFIKAKGKPAQAVSTSATPKGGKAGPSAQASNAEQQAIRALEEDAAVKQAIQDGSKQAP